MADALSREECFDLARKARAGDRAAEERLILCHLPLARIEASRFYRYAGADVSVEDIRAQAELILVEQTRRYDPGRGVPFRAWLAMQLRLRLWNAVGFAHDGPGSKHGRNRQRMAFVELTEDIPADDPEVGVRDLLHDLGADPDMFMAMGLVASGLTAADAAARGIPAERYDALLRRLRVQLGSI